jgi:hypothetical protein
MKTKNEFFKEVYFIDSPEHLTEKQWDNLLIVGKKNWDHYFLPFKTKQEHEKIKNVELVEFESEKEMFKCLKKLSPRLLLNFSLDFKKPCILKFV